MESTPQKIQPYKVSELSFTDADSPALIDVKYNGSEEATLTIDADGGDSSSKLKITITTGSNTYVITPSTDDTNDAEATTLGALVKLINELSENVDGDHYGWHARLRHGDDPCARLDVDVRPAGVEGFALSGTGEEQEGHDVAQHGVG